MRTNRRVWTWKKIKIEKKLLDPVVQSFELAFFNAVLDNDPQNVPILVEVGDLYTRMGRLEDSLEIDERLVKILPQEPIFHYNLACSKSLLGRTTDALRSLKRAIELGYSNFEHLLGGARAM